MSDAVDRSGSIGEIFRAARKARGLSCLQVGEMAGLSKQGISRLECKSVTPTFDAVRKVCKVLKISLNELEKKLPPIVLGKSTTAKVGRPVKKKARPAA